MLFLRCPLGSYHFYEDLWGGGVQNYLGYSKGARILGGSRGADIFCCTFDPLFALQMGEGQNFWGDDKRVCKGGPRFFRVCKGVRRKN